MVKRYLTYLGIVILIFFIPITLVQSVRNATLRTVSPLGQFLVDRNVSIRNFFLSLSQISSLREDKNSLQQQVVALQQQVVTEDAIQSENDALRKELGVTGVTQTIPKVLAHVIIQSGPNELDPTFTIDVGTAQGLLVGQPAIYQGTLIGRLIDVRSHTAVVRLITSAQSNIQAQLADSGERGLLVGTGNGVTLKDITQGVTVANNSIVETSGLGGSLPEGILIGQTASLESASSDSTQSFALSLQTDPTLVTTLFILLTNPQ